MQEETDRQSEEILGIYHLPRRTITALFSIVLGFTTVKDNEQEALSEPSCPSLLPTWYPVQENDRFSLHEGMRVEADAVPLVANNECGNK